MANISEINKKSLLKVKGKKIDIIVSKDEKKIKIFLNSILSPIKAITTEATLDDML